MAAQTFQIIRGLFTAITGVRNFFSSGAAPFTLDDVRRQIASTTGRVFQDRDLTSLRTIRQTFYDSMRPTILDITTITAADLTFGGRLSNIYPELRQDIRRMNRILDQLEQPLWNNANTIHLDDYFRFVRIFTEAYGTLVHMHGVYMQLRCVELGVALSHSHMDADYRDARIYIQNGLNCVNRLVLHVDDQRQNAVGVHTEHYFQGTRIEPPYWFNRMNDSYVRETSTQSPWDLIQLIGVRTFRGRDRGRAAAREATQIHRNNIRTRIANPTRNNATAMISEFQTLTRQIDSRLPTRRSLFTFPFAAVSSTGDAQVALVGTNDVAQTTFLMTTEWVHISGAQGGAVPTAGILDYQTGLTLICGGGHGANDIATVCELAKLAQGMILDVDEEQKVFDEEEVAACPKNLKHGCSLAQPDINHYLYQKKFTFKTVVSAKSTDSDALTGNSEAIVGDDEPGIQVLMLSAVPSPSPYQIGDASFVWSIMSRDLLLVAEKLDTEVVTRYDFDSEASHENLEAVNAV